MSFGRAILTCLEKFMIFQGRASRAEFWWFYLFTLIVGFLAVPLERLLDTRMISTGVGVAFLLPTVSAAARRFHDTGRPAWYLVAPLFALPFFLLGPSAGGTALLFAMAFLILILCLPGQEGSNRYGPDPRHSPDLEAFE